MPSILINEIDATKGGGSAGVVDIAYVPGFMCASTVDGAWPKDKDGKADTTNQAALKEPILCETIADFERYFGKLPVTVKQTSTGISYAELSSIVNINKANLKGTDTFTQVDLSYVYAKELIGLGIPVLYEAVNALAELTAGDIISLYGYLSDGIEGPFGRLKEKGEFDVKYLTTGGYPNWNSSSPDTRKVEAIPSNSSFKDSITIDQATAMPLVEADPDETYIVEIQDPSTEGAEPTITWTPSLPDGITIDKNLLLTKNGNKYIYNGMSVTFKIVGREASENIIPTVMRDCAHERGDCVAFIDHFNSSNRSLVGAGSFYNELVTSFTDSGDGSTVNSFVTAFTPWVNITTVTMDKANAGNYFMPGSYAYLSALGQSIQTNANWLAVAGAARGSIPNLNGEQPFSLSKKLTNTIAEEEYQNRDGVSINAITNIKPFGYRIWGNRTLKNNSFEGNLTATSFLNIRNLVSDVKKVVYQACRKYTFEQNNDLLWTNFKAYIEPTLEKMRTGAGISGYKIIKGTTTEKAKLVATIKLFPIFAVEDFEVTVVMEDDEISVN